ncbi:MAG: GPP34 family phosphoprotein [Ilumatobacteraceae bacterium]
MRLAEDLALVAIDPESGRHALGRRSALNACLAGLLLAELLLDDVVQPGKKATQMVVTGRSEPKSTALAAATVVLIEKGPKIKAVLSHMDRGLSSQLGQGTWDTTMSSLVDAGVLAASSGGLRPHHDVLGQHVRDSVVAALRVAAGGDQELDLRSAALLSMVGPAHLLEVVAPTRATRRHARNRIDHALDGTVLQTVGEIVRRLIADAESAAAGGGVVAVN